MNIEEVLNRYFEGETSVAEERELRRFFAGANVPDHLSAYRPLFAYFDEEIARSGRRDMGGGDSHDTGCEAFCDEPAVDRISSLYGGSLCGGTAGNQPIVVSDRPLFLFG